MAQKDFSQLRVYLDEPDVQRRIERAVEVYQKSEKYIDAANRDLESGKLNKEQYRRTVTGLAADRDFAFDFLQKEKGGIEALRANDKQVETQDHRSFSNKQTKAAQAVGLSNRDDAGPGMLFAFDPPGKLAFWMRDTRIPLTIAFISDEYHLSMKPARFALELAQGQFDLEGLAVGSKLVKHECRPIQ